jgi:hypothetical protein
LPNGSSGAHAVYALDLDLDGDVDIITAAYYGNQIAWYENDGSQNFIHHIISSSAHGASSVFAIDVDSDGDMDVLSSASSGDQIIWYENDGSQNFTTHILNGPANGASYVYATDVDLDGDVDILGSLLNSNQIVWYENNGAQSFTQHVINNSPANRATSVYALDIDRDGDVDVLSSSYLDNKIAWYQNDGNQNFTDHVISTSANTAITVYAADMDYDGDIDVLSASQNDNKIAWYENDGNQNFTEIPISTSAVGARTVFAFDIDNDGDLDVLSSSYVDDKITWYENDLQGVQCSGLIPFHEVGGDAVSWNWSSSNPAVTFSPNNSDQNPFLSGLQHGDTVTVSITDASGFAGSANIPMQINISPDSNFTLTDPTTNAGVPTVVVQSGSELGVSYQLVRKDNRTPAGGILPGTGSSISFNLLPAESTTYLSQAINDTSGCVTLIADSSVVTVIPAVDARIAYGTPSLPPAFTEYNPIVSTSANGAYSAYAIDVDGDGDADIISANFSNNNFAWYENDGDQNFTTHILPNGSSGAHAVYALDLDLDGDVDIITAAYYGNQIAWYENDGSQNFIHHIISSSAHGASSVFAIDVDSDGDMDVLSSASSGDQIIWYENDGSQNFTTHILNGPANGASYVYATDVDLDGDVDILGSLLNSNQIVWYENNGAQSFTQHVINNSPANRATSVYALDIDRDGDVDVLSSSYLDNKIAWYQNDGNQNFTDHVISTSANTAITVYAADMDYDGDIDVLSASQNDNKIAWYENDGNQNFTEIPISTSAVGARTVFAFDIDNDGDLDVLSSSYVDDKITWYENDLQGVQCSGLIPFHEVGGDAVSWNWSSSNPAVTFSPNNSDQNPFLSGLQHGDTVTVSITDASGFAGSANIPMQINITPNAPEAADEAICEGDPIPDLTATGSNVLWFSDTALTNLVGVGNNYNPLVSAAGTYSFYATQSSDAGCESNSAEVTLIINGLAGCPILWTGREYVFGSGINNAPGVGDGARDFVVQGAGAILPGDARVHKMTVETGQDITIPLGISLSIVDAINNEGTVTIKSSGSIVQESIADNNTGTGTYHIERDDIRSETEFQSWSSPIQSAQIMGMGGVFDGSNPCRTLAWNASSQRWKYDYVSGSVYDCGGGNITFTGRYLMFDDPADNLMDPGRGYFILGQVGAPLIVFSGQINNGTLVKPVFETLATSPFTGNDWNLLGNPYPSALGIQEWLDANETMLNTVAVYLWDDDGSGGADYDEYDDYATVNQFGFVGGENGNGKYPLAPVGIATGQGFFIEASTNGNVTFTNAMRIIGDNDKFYKIQPDNNPKLWINLISNSNAKSQTLIGFADDATSGRDRAFDAPIIHSKGILSIGSMIDDRPMAIQAIPPLENGDQRIIPLHMFSKEGGKATLSFTQNETMNEVEVYLKMPQQIAEYPVGSVSFDIHLKKGENPGYALVFRKGSVLANGSINKVFGWELINSNDELIIEITGSLDTDTRVEILDIKGIVHETVILTDRITRINTQNWAAGMYLVHLTSGSTDEVKRVVIR